MLSLQDWKFPGQNLVLNKTYFTIINTCFDVGFAGGVEGVRYVDQLLHSEHGVVHVFVFLLLVEELLGGLRYLFDLEVILVGGQETLVVAVDWIIVAVLGAEGLGLFEDLVVSQEAGLGLLVQIVEAQQNFLL